jgi:hypothetical protein
MVPQDVPKDSVPGHRRKGGASLSPKKDASEWVITRKDVPELETGKPEQMAV